jgi:hypothetical protein
MLRNTQIIEQRIVDALLPYASFKSQKKMMWGR